MPNNRIGIVQYRIGEKDDTFELFADEPLEAGLLRFVEPMERALDGVAKGDPEAVEAYTGLVLMRISYEGIYHSELSASGQPHDCSGLSEGIQARADAAIELMDDARAKGWAVYATKLESLAATAPVWQKIRLLRKARYIRKNLC